MKILWFDDNLFDIKQYIQYLQDSGYEVISCESPYKCKEILKKEKFDLVLLDVQCKLDNIENTIENKAGWETGLVLAREILRFNKRQKIIGFSITENPEIRNWFNQNCLGFISKKETSPDQNFVNLITELICGINIPKVFIVHGHDEESLKELKNYIQKNLKLGKPIILRQEPSLGRTIIEKFEDYSRNIDLVFVLLTPDDIIIKNESSDDVKRRARQNVIFEMGYFYGKIQRKNGQILLLYKGDIELPSDISGIIYINISKGIMSQNELIRKEISHIIKNASK
jgi:predicted nucleotide-binding protein